MAKSANHDNAVVFSNAWAMTKLTTMPEAPTRPNLTNWRTPRLRNPVPIREEDGEEPHKRQREGENHVVHPRTLPPAREDRKHREEDQREARHRHQVRGGHRDEDREPHVRDVRRP